MFPETKSRKTLRFEGNKIHSSPRDQSLSVYYLCLKLTHNYSSSWIDFIPTCYFSQQGRGFHCWHRRCWGRIQGDRGGPKQANRIVWSSRWTWSGSGRHLTWFQTGNFQFSAITANFPKRMLCIYEEKIYHRDTIGLWLPTAHFPWILRSSRGKVSKIVWKCFLQVFNGFKFYVSKKSHFWWMPSFSAYRATLTPKLSAKRITELPVFTICKLAYYAELFWPRDPIPPPPSPFPTSVYWSQRHIPSILFARSPIKAADFAPKMACRERRRFLKLVVQDGIETTRNHSPAAREPMFKRTRNASAITEDNTVKRILEKLLCQEQGTDQTGGSGTKVLRN